MQKRSNSSYLLRCLVLSIFQLAPVTSYRHLSSSLSKKMATPLRFAVASLHRVRHVRWNTPFTSNRHLSSESNSGIYSFNSTSIESMDFGETFKLPTHDEKLPLEIQNSHFMDSSLTFNEEEHSYTYDGIQMKYSVTSIIGEFFEKFDADTAIEKMMSGRNWPRKEYSYPDGSPYAAEKIKSDWDLVGLYARNRGSWMHFNIERVLNGLPPISSELAEMQQFYNFKRTVMDAENIEPYRTEWRIAAPELRLAGTIDCVGKKPDGSYVLMDWKRSKGLNSESLETEKYFTLSYGKKGRIPINHLPDCEGSKYALQLHLYSCMLAKYYGVQISKILLCSFHPNNRNYICTEVPDYSKEADTILKFIHHESLREGNSLF